MLHKARLLVAALLLSLSVGCLHHHLHQGGAGCPHCRQPCAQRPDCPQHRDCPQREDCPKQKESPRPCPNCPQKGVPAEAPAAK